MLHYLLQIITFQLLFLLAYELFLKKETFFNWNRAYLLMTPILSFLLPFVQIPVIQNSIPSAFKLQLPEILVEDITEKAFINGGTLPEVIITVDQSINSATLIFYIWIAGAILSFLFLGFKVLQLVRLARKGQKSQIHGMTCYTISKSTIAFSFFNRLFLGELITEKQRVQILQHELIHIKEKHSLDLLFFEIQRIIFWFNPLVYIYQKEVALLQEFTADAQVVRATSKTSYYQGLLEQVFQTQNISFINTFYKQSFIKKRITMLQKSKSRKSALIKYGMLIPLIASMLFYVGCSEDNSVINTELENSIKSANLHVSYGKFGEKENLVVGVKDISSLSRKEQSFVELAKYEEGFIDLKRNNSSTQGEDVYKDMDELFFVNYTKRLHAVAKSNEVVIHRLDTQFKTWKEGEGEQPKGELIYEYSPDENFYERESKHIHFDDSQAIPYAVIEKVPTYPGCSGTNEDLKKCMSEKISMHVNRNFNTELGAQLGLTGINRIFVSFMINKEGTIVNVRSRAPHPDLETEAKRTILTLPQMLPGKQEGESVDVLYSLPITFKIAD